MNFDELKTFVGLIPAPDQRMGIFRVQINNKGRRYDFHSLKENASSNENVFGFGLNHYGWMNLPKQQFKQSKFHDEEDVSIHINKSEFVNADLSKLSNTLTIEMKNWSAVVTWEHHQ
jgi:hypothetical protein